MLHLSIYYIYTACGTPCGETTSVMSLCHAVLRGLGAKCVCMAPCLWGAETSVCKRGVLQVSGMSGFPEKCLARVSHENVLQEQECPTRVSHKGVPQERERERVSHNTVLQECPGKSVVHESPTGKSYDYQTYGIFSLAPL